MQEVIQKLISELKAADYNPRVMPESQMLKLRQSLREFGFVEPVVVNQHPGREGVIIGGHQRVKAAELEGMTDVPCLMVNLDPTKEKLLNLALNRIHGEWDKDKLIEVIKTIDLEGGDLSLSGFEEIEINDLRDSDAALKPSEAAGTSPRPLFGSKRI